MDYQKAHDIENNFINEPAAVRFEYLYANYSRIENVIHYYEFLIIFYLEGIMMQADWELYLEKYDWQCKKETIERLKVLLTEGSAINFELETGMKTNEHVTDMFKNLQAMKVSYNVFQNAMMCLGKDEQELIEAYLSGKILLNGIAEKYQISYETAKAKIRDIKKEFKNQALMFMAEPPKSA